VAFGATTLLLGVIKKVSVSNGRIQVRSNTRIVFENTWYPWMVLMTQGIMTSKNELHIYKCNSITLVNIIGGNLPSSRLPLRFVAGSWCLMAVVLVYAYNSTLISYISLAKYELVLNTFDDLAASKTLRIITQRGSLSAEIILARENSLIQEKYYCFFSS
jgi:hypothetical protein